MPSKCSNTWSLAARWLCFRHKRNIEAVVFVLVTTRDYHNEGGVYQRRGSF